MVASIVGVSMRSVVIGQGYTPPVIDYTFFLKSLTSEMEFSADYLADFPTADEIGGTFNTSLVGTGVTFPTTKKAQVNDTSSATAGSAYADIDTGLYYFEVVIGDSTSTTNFAVGVCDNFNANTQFGDPNNTYYTSTGVAVGGGSTTSGLATFTTGDTIGVVIDTGALLAYFYKNGVQIISKAIPETDGYRVMCSTFVPAAPSNGITIRTSSGAMTYWSTYLADYPSVVQLGGTYDSANKGTLGTLSAGDTIINYTGTGSVLGTATMSGTRAYEFFVDSPYGIQLGYFKGGFGPPFFPNSDAGGQVSASYYQNSGAIQGYSGSTTGATYTNGDVIGAVVEMGSSMIHFYKNGTFQGSANLGNTAGWAIASRV